MLPLAAFACKQIQMDTKNEIEHALPGDHVQARDLAEVLKTLLPSAKPWHLTSRLLKLDSFLLAGLLSQAMAGFDGSMVNGLLGKLL